MRAALGLPAFRRLAVAYSLTEIGDWVATIALAILVFDETGDPLATTALFVATKFLPGLLVPALTARAERLPSAQALALLYALEGVVFVALAASTAAFALLLVCALAFLDGTLAAVARALVRAGTVAVLTPAGLLREGNAALNVSFGVMNVAGPAAAGFLVAGLGVAPVLTIGAALFAALAALLLRARGTPAAAVDESPWRERLRAGGSYVLRHPAVLALILGQGAFLVLGTMVTPIEVVYAKETLGAGDAGFGALLTAWGAGMVVGSLIFVRLRGRSLWWLLAVSTAAVGGGFLGMAGAPTLAWACAAAALGGVGNGVEWVALVTALQEATTDEMQARVAGFFEAVATAAPGVGFLLGGAVATVLSPRSAFLVAGAGMLLVLVAGAAAVRLRGGWAGASPALRP